MIRAALCALALCHGAYDCMEMDRGSSVCDVLSIQPHQCGPVDATGLELMNKIALAGQSPFILGPDSQIPNDYIGIERNRMFGPLRGWIEIERAIQPRDVCCSGSNGISSPYLVFAETPLKFEDFGGVNVFGDPSNAANIESWRASGIAQSDGILNPESARLSSKSSWDNPYLSDFRSLERKPCPLLDLRVDERETVGVLGGLDCIDGSSGSVAVHPESAAQQDNGPNTHACSKDRQGGDDPLCVRIRRRELGPKVGGFGARLLLILGGVVGFAAAGARISARGVRKDSGAWFYGGLSLALGGGAGCAALALFLG